MTDKEKVLALLSDGRPHTHHEIYALNVMGHSRITNLREDGYVIKRWNEGRTSVYQLLSEPEQAASSSSKVPSGNSSGSLRSAALAEAPTDGVAARVQPAQLLLLAPPGAYEGEAA